MDKSQNNEAFFITSEKSVNKRPRTSYIARNKLSLQQSALNPQHDAQNKLKMYKEQLKKLQNQYVCQLTQLNQSKKVIDKQFRCSQRKKVLFLNLYENRKLKHYEQKLLEQKQQKEKHRNEQVRTKAKSIKLNRQIRSLLIKNELQQTNSVLCTKNKAQKAMIKQKLSSNKSKYYEMARSSYGKIKTAEIDLNIKKQKIGQMQLIMCKQNYYKKLGTQMKYIQNVDKLLNEVEEENSFCSRCTTDKKLTTAADVFITQK